MEPRIVSKPAFTVVGIATKAHVDKHEIPQLWSALGSRVGEIKDLASPGAAYGLTTGFDESTGVFEYVAGFGVEKVEELPEGMGSWEVPEATYAAFTCTLRTLPEVYGYAYKTWLPSSDYERASALEFELYGQEFSPQDPASEFEVYIPIK